MLPFAGLHGTLISFNCGSDAGYSHPRTLSQRRDCQNQIRLWSCLGWGASCFLSVVGGSIVGGTIPWTADSGLQKKTS